MLSGFFKGHFHRLFGFYVLLVFLIWSLPRIIPIEVSGQFASDRGLPFSKFLSIQHIMGGSLLPVAIIFSFFIFFLLSSVLELPRIKEFVVRKNYNILRLIINSYMAIAFCLYFLMLTKEINLLLFLLFLFLMFFLLPKIIAYVKENTLSRPEELSSCDFSPKYIWLTGIIILVLLLIKERMEPFFFVQDDNHGQFFPKILLALRMLLNGEFPFIDNYQHFGVPLFEIGTYGFLNPLMVISFVLAKYLLQNIYTTLDVYSILSIFGGSLFFGYAMRELKVINIAGLAAQVSFSFLGFILVVGRSWYYILGIAFFLPALFYFFVLFIKEKINFWWFLGSSLLRSFFFYSGNIQLFVYAVLIEFVSYVYFALNSNKRLHLYYYFCSVSLTFGIILPLFTCQLISLGEVKRGVEPFFAVGGISLDGILTSFVPYPLTKASHPINHGGQHLWRLSNLYHIGFVWMITFFLSLFSYIKSGKDRFAPLLVLAMFLFILSAGSVSLIYPLKYFVPGLNKTSLAYKIYPFAAFLIIVYGALKLNKIITVFRDRKVFNWIIIINTFVTILVGVFGTNGNACWHLPEKPYPMLPPSLTTNLSKKDFIWSINPHRYRKEPYVTLLSNNYSTLYDLMCINVYDPLLLTMIGMIWGTQGFNKEQIEKRGITRIIYQKVPRFRAWQKGKWRLKRYLELYEDEDFVLYGTGYPSWIIKQADGLPGFVADITEYTRSKIKARIYSEGSSKWLYHNEYRKGYKLLLNGRKSKIFNSFDGWCLFELPSKGFFEVEIKYVPQGFRESLFIGIVLVLMSVLAYIFYSKGYVT